MARSYKLAKLDFAVSYGLLLFETLSFVIVLECFL